MPIDLSLLRPLDEGGSFDEVKRWQILRLPPKEKNTRCSSHPKQEESSSMILCKRIENVESLIQTISHLEKEKRRLLKETCQSRARLKQLQSSLAPCITKQKQKHGDEIVNEINVKIVRQEIEQLKKIIIPALQEESHNVTDRIDLLSPRLKNMVATGGKDNREGFQSIDDSDYDSNKKNKIKNDEEPLSKLNHSAVILDPLYCVGGYERIVIPTWNYDYASPSLNLDIDDNEAAKRVMNEQEKAYLSGYGSIIYDALLAYIRKEVYTSFHFGTNSNSCNNPIIEIRVPASIPLLSTELAHSLMGCTVDDDRILSTETAEVMNCEICQSKYLNDKLPLIAAPSHIALSMLHQNKSFSDRELPKKFLSTTSISQVDISKGQASSSSSSLRLIHSINRLEIFVIATSNLRLSTKIQDDIAENIITMYKSLLVSMSDDINSFGCANFSSQQCSKSTPTLRTRSISPSNLEPSEARRLIIEGYLPFTGKYVCLGHVSNYTDYISRGIKVKCNGGHGQPNQYCHLLHGHLCNQEALIWLMENNVFSITSSEHSKHNQLGISTYIQHEQRGVMIPSNLAGDVGTGVMGRKMGKSLLFLPFVRELTKRKGGKTSTKEIKGSKEPTWIELGSQAHLEKKSSLTEKVNDKKATFDLTFPSARDEAACNPYDFLPFQL